MTETETKEKSQADSVSRVAFNLAPAMVEELKRILAMTELGSNPELFRRAFTLLRIHVDAAARGREIYMVDPDRPDEKFVISLPFTIHSSAEPVK